jgi:hypothetical protein
LYLDKKTVLNDKKIPYEMQKQGIKSVSFVPVSTIRLVSGKIKYLLQERYLSRVAENGDKTVMAQAGRLDEKTNYTLWIGLDLHPEVETLQHLSFFIDFPHATNKYQKYSVLPYSRWTAGTQTLDMTSGLPGNLNEDTEEREMSGGRPPFLKYDLLSQTDNNIADFYRMQFLTVANDIKLATLGREACPQEIRGLFPETLTASMEPCLWIKVVFHYITLQDMQDMVVHINAFPVANKTLYSSIYNCKGVSCIVPLPTLEGEYFLSVENVSDSQGREYNSIPYTAGRKMETGIYSIKRGDAERFDRRNAKEYLERLIDLLRSEASAFASFDTDNMRNIIADIQKGLANIETKYENSEMGKLETPNYLLFDVVNRDETLFVEYWATLCEQANGIRTGKVLTPFNSVPVVKDSCRLLKMTSGGKPVANINGKQDAFRYVLTSRDQIVTFKDVENFCRLELGGKISHMDISRGYAISAKPKEGFIRTINIHLTPAPGCGDMVRGMESELLTLLHQKSPDSFNYRITVESQTQKQ